MIKIQFLIKAKTVLIFSSRLALYMKQFLPDRIPHIMLFQGMVDPGESVTKTLQREFVEEVESTDGLSEEEAKKIKKRIDKFIFSGGTEVS